MVDVAGTLNSIKTLGHNVRHPKAYFSAQAAKEAVFVGCVKRDVQVLTTSEKGFFGRILDKIKIALGSKGAFGDVVRLTYCQDQLKKYVVTQQNGKQAFSCNAVPMQEFKAALLTRATLLNLTVSDKMLRAYTKQLLENTFGEKLPKQEAITLSKTLFATDEYSKTAKVALRIGKAALGMGEAALLGPVKVSRSVGKAAIGLAVGTAETAIGAGVISTAALVGALIYCDFFDSDRCQSLYQVLKQRA